MKKNRGRGNPDFWNVRRGPAASDDQLPGSPSPGGSMIRTFLASPRLPLVYWAAAIIAMICAARHESLKRLLGPHESGMIVTDSSTFQTHSGLQANTAVCQPTHFWYPQLSILQRPDRSVQTELAKKTPISTESQTSVSAPITMLSIRVDPPEQTMAKRLAIQCRTSVPLSNAVGRTVTIHGVVTQEVVTSTGKILIMAGSRVVGAGLLDPENGRFKSDGLWSIFLDDAELKVQAQLLDRMAGLPGLLGRETSNEGDTLRREAVMRDGRSIFVPRDSPFVLEIHGEMLLRDLKSNDASN